MAFLRSFCQFWKRDSESELDLYSVLESVNWIWCGSGVLIVVPEGPVGRRRYVTRKFLIGYDIFLFCVFAASFFEQFFDGYIYKIVENLGSDVRVSMFIRQSSNWTNMLNAISWKILTNNEFIETIDSLSKQDRILHAISCPSNYTLSRKVISVCVRTYFTINLIFSFHEFLYFGFNFSMFLDWITWWLPLIVHKTSICLFLCLIWLAGVRFRTLNEKLEFIVRSSVPNSPLQMSSEECVRIIRIIGNVHLQLNKIVQSLCHIFIITLLTSALEAFVFVTILLFSLIIDIQQNEDYVRFLSDSFLLVMCGIPIITIVSMCNWTRKQASGAGKLMKQINIDETNSVLSELIQIFSMQVIHQKLSFSVGGLFTLDPAFLQAMTAAVTTYLIILIQFGEMDNVLLHGN